ncbi:prolipoprotein diacylglyceryl transferase [Haloimpatiens lingqiaonensis]|uniref:prolipoprotein diacylglyceryl transferase n=1 Tax=Haloimpatiens lingqiaonensis TaxID=1380675 RepID=UPI0010FF357A|nr:prolipoprotein diacylglyceryl transferase [Haloimpatiens lingqiaonensis]
MRPILFEVFGIKVYGYGTMIAIGILAAIILLNYRVKKREYNEDKISNMTIIAIISGVLGGKLLFVITEFKNIIKDISILKDLQYGFVIYGAILGGTLGVYIYCKKNKWRILDVFDLVIPTIPLAQGFGRIGCFLAGCCYGRATDSCLGVEFMNSDFAPAGIHVHPTQIYSSIFDFALCIFLLWYDKKNKKEGRVFAMYFILYGIGRFLVEFLRDDPRGNVGILSTSQFISIIMVIVAILVFNIDKILKRKKEEI